MTELFSGKKEKKVEYIELIYDLIFVYILGRSNTIIHTIENGFIAPSVFLTYILSTFVILQVWYSSVLFINKYGENGLQENLMIFINMYLLYYMADGTRAQWQDFYMRYNTAWALILLNLIIQYLIKYRRASENMPWITAHIKRSAIILSLQLLIVLISLPLYRFTSFPLAPFAMLFGIIASLLSRKYDSLVSGDFEHLTERIMLYVVFTFGEMIIAIANYFEGGFSLNSIYFSLSAFLIVAGLFLSYGFMYNNVIDRGTDRAGTRYMLLHVFLITALNNITVALEFMRNEKVLEIPKNIFMTVSLIAYFFLLFTLEKYAKTRCRANKKFLLTVALMSALYAGLTALTYNNGFLSILIAVIYIYSIFLYLYISVKRNNKA